jgi:predicted AAA+ superfamily ATPase
VSSLTRVFIRDGGLLHHLLNIATLEDLHNHPMRGASWEEFVVEDLMRRERMAHPFTQFFFWRTATGQEADLVLDRGTEKIVLEIKANSGTNLHDARKLETVLDDTGARAGWIISQGVESTQLSTRVRSVSLDRNPGWLP